MCAGDIIGMINVFVAVWKFSRYNIITIFSNFFQFFSLKNSTNIQIIKNTIIIRIETQQKGVTGVCRH
jgi:hypothetical protein